MPGRFGGAAIALVVCLGAGTTAAEKTKEEEVDRVGLAAIMLKDGHPERALSLLAEVDLEDEDEDEDEVIDRVEYHRLRGLAELRLQRFEEAVTSFQRALEAGDQEPRTVLFLAQSELAAGRADSAAATLQAAPPGTRAIPEAYLLEAIVHFKREDKFSAFSALQAGHERFPDHREIAQRRVFLLVDMGLYQTAVDASSAFLSMAEAKPSDYVALAEALRKGGELKRAALLLEQAMLRYPDDREIRNQLALTYMKLDQPLTAAELLQPMALLDAEAAMHAAELYRQARKRQRAGRMNARVLDQKAKIRQKLGLLIEEERYEEAASLDPRLSRLGLLEDEPMLYALAYAHFKTSNFGRAEVLLSRLTDAELFRKGVALRRAMEACVQAEWRCE